MSDPHTGSTEPDHPADQAHTSADVDGVAVPRTRARTWAVVGAIGAVTAIWFVFPGIIGMGAGSVAHLKGDRWGMPVAIASGLTTLVGMALVFWVRP